MKTVGRLTSKSTNITYVVYSLKDGKIVHTHESESHDGKRQIPESEVEETALELTCMINDTPRSEIAALRVQKEVLEQAVKYEVDLQRKALVERHS